MAKERTLERLLRLRRLEEELSRQELEHSVAERNYLHELRRQTLNEGRVAQRYFVDGVRQADPIGRMGGLVEMEAAQRRLERLAPAVAAAEDRAERLQAEFQERRTARRQVETLADEQQTEAKKELARRAQQILDDWYGRKSSERASRRRSRQ